jgi:hypothetical protein
MKKHLLLILIFTRLKLCAKQREKVSLPLQTDPNKKYSILILGVWHTIEFPNRNQILTNAYLWLDSVRTTQIYNFSFAELESHILVYPTVIAKSQSSLAIEAISSQIGRNIYLVNEVNQIIFKDKILNLNFRLEVSFA